MIEGTDEMGGIVALIGVTTATYLYAASFLSDHNEPVTRNPCESSPRLAFRIAVDVSGGERKTTSGPAEHQLFRHFLFGQVYEVLPAAMHGKHVLEIEFLQFRHDRS